MSAPVYFNFPINFIPYFLYNSIEDGIGADDPAFDIMAYCIYWKHREYRFIHDEILHDKDNSKYEYADVANSVRSAFEYYGITGNEKVNFEKGKLIYESIPEGMPFTGLSKDTLFQFYNSDKTQFERLCLCAMLALKSILGKKKYAKTNFTMLFSRMSGLKKSVDSEDDLHENIKGYYGKGSNNYHGKKIIASLELNWGLKYYSYYMRGFYFSFDMNLEDLILIAEKKRESNKAKALKAKKISIRQDVRNKLKL